MLRLIFWFAVMVAAVAGLTWLAEHPGTITIDWLGWHIEDLPVALALGVLAVTLLLLWLVVWFLRLIFAAPGATRDWFRLRRRRKGLNAISEGLVALLAGDAASARKAAHTAKRLIPDEPVARLLEARAAQEMGDDATARRLLEDMLREENTAAAALHGLYEQAMEEGDVTRARRLTAEAWKRYPGLPWAGFGLLRFLARDGEWQAVLTLLDDMKKRGLLDKTAHARQKAAALTARALELEDHDPEQALDLALRAHKLDPALVPAAVLAGGMLAARGKLRKAARILERTWKLSPHPDIAEVYAHLRPGDSPKDRLKRLEKLLRMDAGGEEGAVAHARAAIEAGEWETARGALRPWLNENPSARIFTLLAEIEEKGYGDYGRAREWLARAVRARHDPVWTADGMVAPEWLPVSPFSGQIGVFEWRTPVKGDERLAMPEPVPAELLEPPKQKVLPKEETSKAHDESSTDEKDAPDTPPLIEVKPEETKAEAEVVTNIRDEPSDEKESSNEPAVVTTPQSTEGADKAEGLTALEDSGEAIPAAEAADGETASSDTRAEETKMDGLTEAPSIDEAATPRLLATEREHVAPPPGHAPRAPRAPRPSAEISRNAGTQEASSESLGEEESGTEGIDRPQTTPPTAGHPDASANDQEETTRKTSEPFTPPLPDDPGPLPPDAEEDEDLAARPRRRWRLFG